MNNNLETVLNEDVKKIFKINIPWNKFRNKKILITGGNGFIANYFINIFYKIKKNKKQNN